MKKKIIVWNREFSTDPGDWKYEDQYTGRKVPMEVLCLGMSRTGTSCEFTKRSPTEPRLTTTSFEPSSEDPWLQ